MVARVRSDGDPFPDRRKQHEQEVAALRSRLSAIVQLVFGIFALFLAVGALLVVFGKNVHSDNPLVRLVFNVDNTIDGPLSRDHGVFVFHGPDGHKWDAVANWGLAAAVYLICGSILRKLLMPHTVPARPPRKASRSSPAKRGAAKRGSAMRSAGEASARTARATSAGWRRVSAAVQRRRRR